MPLETVKMQVEEVRNTQQGSPPAAVRVETRQNHIGLAGFILSLFSLAGCWIPVLNLVTCILGLIFSVIGMFTKPRGFAIAGFTVSVICIGIMALMVYVLAETVRSIAGLLDQANI